MYGQYFERKFSTLETHNHHARTEYKLNIHGLVYYLLHN